MKLSALQAVTLLPVMAVFSTNVFASLVQTQNSLNLTNRTCSAINDSNYLPNWRNAMLATVDWDNNSLIDAQEACYFNNAWQPRWNEDGTAPDPSLPNGVAYDRSTIPAASRVVDASSTLDRLHLMGTNTWSTVDFDRHTGTALPNITVGSYSTNPDERKSASAFSDTTYVWSGDATTLIWSVDTRIDTSTGVWSAGEMDIPDWLFTSMLNVTVGSVNYRDEIEDSELGIGGTLFSTLAISFDVVTGTEFTLSATGQAFGLNGGFAQTQLYNGLLTDNENNDVSAFVQNPTAQVSEPSTLAILGLSILGFGASRRLAKRASD